MKTFKKEDLLNLLDDYSETLEKVSDTITSKSRWSINNELIFREKATGRFFGVGYSVGATEQQDEGPWEHDGDDIEVKEMVPVQRMVTFYEPAPVKSP